MVKVYSDLDPTFCKILALEHNECHKLVLEATFADMTLASRSSLYSEANKSDMSGPTPTDPFVLNEWRKRCVVLFGCKNVSPKFCERKQHSDLSTPSGVDG